MKCILIIFLFFGFQNLNGQANLVASDPLGNRLQDSLALVDFNLKARGELWKVKWDFTKPLDEWFGVQLNAYGRVFCIDLDGFPDCTESRNGGNHLHGELTDLKLPYLEHLLLSSNQLRCTIPDFTGLAYLRTLQLCSNKFYGTIPSFDNLTQVVKIDLEYNELSGSIPAFEKLVNLETIYIGHNQLEGTLPAFGQSTKLQQIYAGYNQLTDCPDTFDGLPELRQLMLSYNDLSGSLPDFSSTLKLGRLDLSFNNFEGCFYNEQWSHIESFNIEGNQVSLCDISSNTNNMGDAKVALMAYPNPSDAMVFVRLTGQENKEFALLTLESEEISLPIVVSNDILSFNIETLPAGVYLLKIGNSYLRVVRN